METGTLPMRGIILVCFVDIQLDAISLFAGDAILCYKLPHEILCPILKGFSVIVPCLLLIADAGIPVVNVDRLSSKINARRGAGKSTGCFSNIVNTLRI